MSRTLECTRCHASIEVVEAAWGASAEEEHLYLDPSKFVGASCGCLQPKPLSEEEPPAWMADAVGRARTDQQRATRDGRRTA